METLYQLVILTLVLTIMTAWLVVKGEDNDE